MAVSPAVLIIDDDEVIRDSCREVLELEGYHVRTADRGETGLDLIGEVGFDLVFLDLKMPGTSGMDVLERARICDPELLVVVITAFGSVENAVQAMKLGAFDFVAKPFSPDELKMVTKRGVKARRLALQNRLLREELHHRYEDSSDSNILLGDSRAMAKVREMVHKVAPTDSTVLLLGETGTGKEIVARLIHQCSLRSSEPLLVVDCGSLVENLFESELFGHTRGAFTGAIATKYGRFELANGGTLFFDEIGNIGPNIQSKLLRAIQEREITRVGGSHSIQVDVRIIAATNIDIVEAVQSGAFREDLFYRLSVVPIFLPALRDRKEDIPALAEHLLKKHSRRRKRPIEGFSPAAFDELLAYDWPGNVRELESVIERAIVLATTSVLQPSDLSFFGKPRAGGPGRSGNGMKSLAEMEAEHIRHVLGSMNGQVAKAADVLGINRKTLRAKIQRYGLGGSGTLE